MKLLLLALSTLFITSAFASDAVMTQTVTCKKVGQTGINVKGTLKSIYRTHPSGALELVDTALSLKNLQFVVNGAKGSSIPEVKASTLDVGDGGDIRVATFLETSSPRITNIELVLTNEGQRTQLSSFRTSKGNVYTTACTASAGY